MINSNVPIFTSRRHILFVVARMKAENFSTNISKEINYSYSAPIRWLNVNFTWLNIFVNDRVLLLF